jgi:hypothetical protein
LVELNAKLVELLAKSGQREVVLGDEVSVEAEGWNR